MGTTADLARFIAETHYDDLPAEVVAAAKIGILDGVANLLGGSTQPVAQLVSSSPSSLPPPRCRSDQRDSPYYTLSPSIAKDVQRYVPRKKVRTLISCAKASTGLEIPKHFAQ